MIKKIILIIFITFFSNIYSQIKEPSFGSFNSNWDRIQDFHIYEIDLNLDYTILRCRYKNINYQKDGWFSISKDTYLLDIINSKKHRLLKVEGISFSPKKTLINFDETKTFNLYFEKLPNDISLIDLVEDDNL